LKLLIPFCLYLNLILAGASAEATQLQPKELPECTVWLFLDPECPICQSYTLRMRNIYESYASRGVAFRALYTSPVINKRAIKNFHEKYNIPFAGEVDKRYRQAERWDATVTPEVVVTSPIGQVLYQGAIDNWYYALGKNRPEPTEHYLKDALDAFLAGKPIEKKRTKAVGCLMNR